MKIKFNEETRESEWTLTAEDEGKILFALDIVTTYVRDKKSVKEAEELRALILKSE
jgi:hypothetical protein